MPARDRRDDVSDATRRTLPGPGQDRRGRHGHGLPRARRGARAHGGDKDHAAPVRERPLVRGALQAGGPGRRGAAEPLHRERLRLGQGRRHLLHRHGVPARHRPQERHPQARRARLQEGRPDRLPDRAGALRGAPSRHHPPRHQAAEHHGAARRQHQGDGLRHRPGEEQPPHAGQLGPRHRPLRLPRADPGQGARAHDRHLLPRHRHVRGGHRPGALPGRRRHLRRPQAGERAAQAAQPAQPQRGPAA